MGSDQILICEDDTNLGLVIQKHLKGWGYESEIATNGIEGLRIIKRNKAKALLLDISLPKLSGMDVLHNIRLSGHNIPVIIMTNYNQDLNELSAYQNGANLFHPKPLKFELLKSQLSMLLREMQRGKDICLKELTLKAKKRVLQVEEQIYKLSRKEFELLYLLMSHPGEAFTRTEIIAQLYIDHLGYSEGAVDTLVSRLRNKLQGVSGGELIETVHGYGYRLNLNYE